MFYGAISKYRLPLKLIKFCFSLLLTWVCQDVKLTRVAPFSLFLVKISVFFFCTRTFVILQNSIYLIFIKYKSNKCRTKRYFVTPICRNEQESTLAKSIISI